MASASASRILRKDVYEEAGEGGAVASAGIEEAADSFVRLNHQPQHPQAAVRLSENKTVGNQIQGVECNQAA